MITKREDYILVILLKSASHIREEWEEGRANELTSIPKGGLLQKKGQLLQQPAMWRALTLSTTVWSSFYCLVLSVRFFFFVFFLIRCFCFVLFSNWLQLPVCLSPFTGSPAPGALAGQPVDSLKMYEVTDDRFLAVVTHVLSHVLPHPVNLLYHA